MSVVIGEASPANAFETEGSMMEDGSACKIDLVQGSVVPQSLHLQRVLPTIQLRDVHGASIANCGERELALYEQYVDSRRAKWAAPQTGQRPYSNDQILECQRAYTFLQNLYSSKGLTLPPVAGPYYFASKREGHGGAESAARLFGITASDAGSRFGILAAHEITHAA